MAVSPSSTKVICSVLPCAVVRIILRSGFLQQYFPGNTNCVQPHCAQNLTPHFLCSRESATSQLKACVRGYYIFQHTSPVGSDPLTLAMSVSFTWRELFTSRNYYASLSSSPISHLFNNNLFCNQLNSATQRTCVVSCKGKCIIWMQMVISNPFSAQLGGIGHRWTVLRNNLPSDGLKNQQALISATNFPITYGGVRHIKETVQILW